LAIDARDAHCAQQVRDMTRGGVDFAFEMADSVAALDLAYLITRRGGTTNLGFDLLAQGATVRQVIEFQ
jgi:Zn-dependent alcohol dehydrogenase